jgi:hypothetical protein
MGRTLVVLILLGLGRLALAAETPPAGTPQSTATVGGSASPSPVESPRSLPPCTQAGAPVAIPPEFPKNISLPPGTVITGARRAGAAIVLEGFVPMELKEATRFFVKKLPEGGFRLGRGEAERGEAESRFGGNGIAGYFKIRVVPDCPGVLQLAMTVSEYKPAASASPH